MLTPITLPIIYFLFWKVIFGLWGDGDGTNLSFDIRSKVQWVLQQQVWSCWRFLIRMNLQMHRGEGVTAFWAPSSPRADVDARRSEEPTLHQSFQGLSAQKICRLKVFVILILDQLCFLLHGHWPSWQIKVIIFRCFWCLWGLLPKKMSGYHIFQACSAESSD